MEPLCSVDVIMNWDTHCGKQSEASSEFKVELPYDLAIPLLGNLLKKTKTQI